MTQPFKRTQRRGAGSAHARLFGSGQLNRSVHCAIIVAHPADEIIGAGCLISKLVQVSVLHTTNGRPARSQSPTSENREEYIRKRRKETKAALSLVNVNSDDVVELDLEGETAALSLPDLTRRITNFLQQTGADIVITHPYEGGHPDHDATAFATHTATRLMKTNGFRPPVLFEMALHPDDDGEGRRCEFLGLPDRETTTLLLDERALALKQQMYERLETQRRSIELSELDAERFRQPYRYDFNAPPQNGPLYYEQLNLGFTSEQWQSLAREALSVLFPKNGQAH